MTSAPATSWSICAIDNLAKGASGGAVQAANVALGLTETAGLSPSVSVSPYAMTSNAAKKADDARRSIAVHPAVRRARPWS